MVVVWEGDEHGEWGWWHVVRLGSWLFGYLLSVQGPHATLLVHTDYKNCECLTCCPHQCTFHMYALFILLMVKADMTSISLSVTNMYLYEFSSCVWSVNQVYHIDKKMYTHSFIVNVRNGSQNTGHVWTKDTDTLYFHTILCELYPSGPQIYSFWVQMPNAIIHCLCTFNSMNIFFIPHHDEHEHLFCMLPYITSSYGALFKALYSFLFWKLRKCTEFPSCSDC